MRPPHVAVGLLMLIFAPLGWLWLTLLSPFTYERPAHLPDIEPGRHRVFVYGTLRLAPVRWVVMGRAGETQPAVIEGYRREALDLEASPEDRVRGEVIIVNAEELRRLDRYERLGIRYERVPMRLADGQLAWVYRRRDEAAQPHPAIDGT
ncbi:gamma-glutamylcyclotransferase [Billgrantia pellis]|uniref:Gamma-glutamylcyclotransferase n=1 Tax=Billgrantia pellis TaxID=2606936 RepID=A0A7V7G1V4_9GAMM|nr:gamma-glutamylcyclotransferase family protein [Halomonas pellis]KAA0013501.1 gamma-glutamylcyclotransferase [Halomonas pellis]